MLIKNFFDKQKEIKPIEKKIGQIIETVAVQNKVKLTSRNIGKNYITLIKINREFGSIIYDAIKQIPEFISLISKPKVIRLMEQLIGFKNIGIAHGGIGFRINNPKEKKFLAKWHQEFPVQLRSEKGIVLWSPIQKVTKEMGPVNILESSHKSGIHKVKLKGNNNLNSAYNVEIQEIDKLCKNFKKIHPLSSPGDVLLLDFLTIHKSGINISKLPLISMQIRYFSFDESSGKKIGWCSGVNNINKLSKYYPNILKGKV